MSRHSRLAAGAVLLTSLACGGGGGGAAPPTAPVPVPGDDIVVVEVLDNSFSPKRLTVEPGTTVRWVNMGRETNHTTTEMAMEWDSGFVFLAPGDTYEHTFNQDDEGQTFEYSCVTHKACCAMQGSVRVGQNAPPPSPGY